MNYPFENDTERIEKRIAEKSVFSEKNRTFLIRVIILIAAFLLSFSGILLCNATLSTQQIAHVNNTTEAAGHSYFLLPFRQIPACFEAPVLFGTCRCTVHTAGSLPENISHRPCTAGSKAPSHSACSDNR